MRILDAPWEGSVTGEVWAVERHGKENVAIVQTVDGRAMRILTMLDVALCLGEKPVFSFDPENAYLYLQLASDEMPLILCGHCGRRAEIELTMPKVSAASSEMTIDCKVFPISLFEQTAVPWCRSGKRTMRSG